MTWLASQRVSARSGQVVALYRVDDLTGDFIGLPSVTSGEHRAQPRGLGTDLVGGHRGDGASACAQGTHLQFGESRA
jgi:hypothetical protein